MNQNRTCFLPPFDGWTDRSIFFYFSYLKLKFLFTEYIVIYKIDSPGPDIADVKKGLYYLYNKICYRVFDSFICLRISKVMPQVFNSVSLIFVRVLASRLSRLEIFHVCVKFSFWGPR